MKAALTIKPSTFDAQTQREQLEVMLAVDGTAHSNGDDEDTAEDETPLLVDEDGAVDREGVNAKPSRDEPNPLFTLIFYFMAIHFLIAFAEIIIIAPLMRLFEDSLCLEFYQFPPGGVEESLCKIPEIQQPLATIRGWQSMLSTIPGIPTFPT